MTTSPDDWDAGYTAALVQLHDLGAHDLRDQVAVLRHHARAQRTLAAEQQTRPDQQDYDPAHTEEGTPR